MGFVRSCYCEKQSSPTPPEILIKIISHNELRKKAWMFTHSSLVFLILVECFYLQASSYNTIYQFFSVSVFHLLRIPNQVANVIVDCFIPFWAFLYLFHQTQLPSSFRTIFGNDWTFAWCQTCSERIFYFEAVCFFRFVATKSCSVFRSLFLQAILKALHISLVETSCLFIVFIFICFSPAIPNFRLIRMQTMPIKSMSFCSLPVVVYLRNISLIHITLEMSKFTSQ